MAHTKAAGSTRLGRESHSKRLGVKLFDGEKVETGNVIVRQRGSKWLSGANVRRGGDDTLYASKAGTIKFLTKKIKRFDGSRRIAKMVKVQ